MHCEKSLWIEKANTSLVLRYMTLMTVIRTQVMLKLDLEMTVVTIKERFRSSGIYIQI